MRLGSLFDGMGGFPLAARRRMGHRTEKKKEISERTGKGRGMKTNEVNLGKFRLTGLNEQIDLLNKAIDELKYAADALRTSREKALTLIHEAALISPKLVVVDNGAVNS